ncbi:phage head morphogenesis protein [Methylomonas sp. SURF-1]|uniref:Phage head morphogenesis protein n=1 Tax=Methylomonas aurea TaxID=2952224 RepID=A0ABT1UKG3_9GAMM|nr:phage minor head protein [Methylomonas sp. SURF-1]MCQ8182179.1 phage head morphogenesis protein [Methylomonas sp. SURF-1]
MPLKLSPTQVAFNARGDGKFNQPFQEQVDFFRQKLNLPTERFDDILKDAHDRAFVVAGAMKADLLNDLRLAVDRSIAEGKSIQWFRNEFDNIVAKHGWTGWTGEGTQAGRDWRTRVIYRTNLSTSYAAGRWAQLNDPALLKLRPYWKYVHNDTVLHPRPLHQSWSGMVLKHDDPFWQTHFPPNGWGCRCRVTAVSAREYKGLPPPDDGTYIYKSRDGIEHVLPKGIDYGWDYAPGASIKGNLRTFVETKAATLPAPIAETFKQDVAKAVKLPAVSDSLTLPKSGFAKAAASQALKAIDAVHAIENLPTIPLKSSTSAKFQGVYMHATFSGRPIEIALSKSSVNPELTVAHEVGHFIDHHGFGVPGTFSSEADPLFEAWRNAIAGSNATAELKKQLADATDRWSEKRVRYYLKPLEQWARSYAQWVALRSQNAAMLDQVKAIATNAKNPVYAASQWSDADFEPIANAIDDIFRAKGWLK